MRVIALKTMMLLMRYLVIFVKMRWLWSSSFLGGIGALVACYGLGLIYLSKHSKKKEQENEG